MKYYNLIIIKLIIKGGEKLGKQDIEIFMNDNFKVLYWLYNNQVKINKAYICPATQQEIGEGLGFSLMKVNSIMLILRQEGYIDKYKNSRGRYIITTKGENILKFFYECSN